MDSIAGDAGTSQYVHGTDPAEQARLSRLNDLLNHHTIRELALTREARILDVGSGLGQLSRAMARSAAPGAMVVGIERSPEQLATARSLAGAANESHLVDFRQGDATRLPLHEAEWSTFDLAHTRFLLEHVTDPLAVVRQMVAAVRPGGRIVLQDDSHEIMRFHPEPPGFDRLWRAYMRTYDRLGNDPYVGHRLVSLLVAAGAKPTRNTWVFFGACAGQPELEMYVENLAHIMEQVRDVVLTMGDHDAESFDCAVADLRAWADRPDAALWYAISWAEGIKS